jgi:epoxyqueuosine reductase QueG
MQAGLIKQEARLLGADACGVASVDRFGNAPEGFRPQDIFEPAKSVIVFLRTIPSEILDCRNPVPYTGAAFLLYQEIDRLGLSLVRYLNASRIRAVPIPCDTPYLHWEPDRMRGQGILSMRHAAHLAGLGYIARSTLLINRSFGTMVYIGAVLTDQEFESAPIVTDSCPGSCRICLDVCPVQALDGRTVDQQRCRPRSFSTNPRGFTLYDCCLCRRSCPRKNGY